MEKTFSSKVKAITRIALAGIKNVTILAKGQSHSDQLLQLAHRLEKGLTISNPRSMWGWDKSFQLVQLLKQYDNKEDTVFQISASVLHAYFCTKQQLADPKEINNIAKLEKELNQLNLSAISAEKGGAMAVTKENLRISEDDFLSVKHLFETRHSIRDFAKTEVSPANILQAIELANRCPSACNRQPYHVYVIDGKQRENLGFRNEFQANKYLLITGRISAFKITELNDWLISPTIFASYLTLSLHALGIGSCIMRKDLVRKTKYNRTMQSFCKIPKTEQIVLEIAIGNYKDSFLVPVSGRVDAKSLVDFVENK